MKRRIEVRRASENERLEDSPLARRSLRPLATERGESSTPFQRWLAEGYDWFFDRVDARGGAEHRRRLAEGATGDVVEIGAGTGRNLPLYGQASLVVALEPDAGMRARAQEVARNAPAPVEVVDGRAEELPFPDGSFHTVVASCVLCTVSNPDRALAEAQRVLRPGGTLRFYEHVRSADARLARWQDLLEVPWAWLARGDHPNRDTMTAITRAGLRVVEMEVFPFEPCPDWSAHTSLAWRSATLVERKGGMADRLRRERFRRLGKDSPQT